MALERMAGDVLSLRQQVTSLEVENRHLRRSLASRDELGQELLTDGDTDVMTREELLDRMGAWWGWGPLSRWPGPCLGTEDVAPAVAATLKHQLVAGAAEMRRLKDRVQQLQNELIRVRTLRAAWVRVGWRSRGAAGRASPQYPCPERLRTPTMRLSRPNQRCPRA